MTARDHLLELGAVAWARGAWFEAHEHWESAWRLSFAPDRLAVQALAQLAAALVHLSGDRLHRLRGAASLLAKAHRKLLLPEAPGAVGAVDMTRVRSAIEQLRSELAAGRTPELGAVAQLLR
jgi:predicted metal-dependent hydrolase